MKLARILLQQLTQQQLQSRHSAHKDVVFSDPSLHPNPSLTPATSSPPTFPSSSIPSPAALVDTFDRKHSYLRVSLTEKCNLRCRYCMPEHGVDLTAPNKLLSPEEFLRVAKLFVRLGIDKIRLTGGEPLVYPQFDDVCTELSKISGLKTLALSTNGLLLQRKLPVLVKSGVRHVNISLDTIQEPKFAFISRRNGLHKVMEAIDAAIAHNMVVKVNCVVMKGFNDDELADLVGLTKTRAMSMRFIELMPFDDNKWNPKQFLSYQDQLEAIREVYPTLEHCGESVHDTAKLWYVPGFQGTVGFITSMSDHFCAGCNRLRLTADGHLKVCLFDRNELSLKQRMLDGASDVELEQCIRDAVMQKHFRHGGQPNVQALAGAHNRPMIRIGG